jgi:hypothetical protein
MLYLFFPKKKKEKKIQLTSNVFFVCFFLNFTDKHEFKIQGGYFLLSSQNYFLYKTHQILFTLIKFSKHCSNFTPIFC